MQTRKTETEQTVTLTGPPYGRPVIIREQVGPDRWGPESRTDHWLLKIAGDRDLEATLEVAQQADRFYKANTKQVVVTVANDKGIAIRPA